MEKKGQDDKMVHLMQYTFINMPISLVANMLSIIKCKSTDAHKNPTPNDLKGNSIVQINEWSSV